MSSETKTIDRILNAINTAQHNRLRAVLRLVCLNSNTALNLVARELLATVSSAESSNDSHLTTSALQSDMDNYQGSTSTRTSASYNRTNGWVEYAGMRYSTCYTCGEEYDVTLNDDFSCCWHDGTLLIDWEHELWFWEDPANGEPCGADQRRRSDPDAFLWSCCSRNGADDGGCRRSAHSDDFF